LCDNCEKKCQLISAVSLHFSKKIKFFSNFVSTGEISLKVADYDEFSIFRNFKPWPRPQKFLMKIS